MYVGRFISGLNLSLGKGARVVPFGGKLLFANFRRCVAGSKGCVEGLGNMGGEEVQGGVEI